MYDGRGLEAELTENSGHFSEIRHGDTGETGAIQRAQRNTPILDSEPHYTGGLRIHVRERRRQGPSRTAPAREPLLHLVL